MNKDDTGEEMMVEDMADDEMMDEGETDEEMMGDDRADDEMMDDDDADQEMMDDGKMMDEDETGEEIINDDNTDEAMAVPDWFKVELTDVNSGETFRIADYQGKVILLETMAVWCPTCTRQQQEIQAVHEMLGERDDFVSVSLDVDPNESEDILKAHTDQNGFEWNFAVAPRELTRALGNLYSAQYLNPPVTPMMIIDRQGQVYGLPFGNIKKASNLKSTLDTHLNGG